MRAHGVIVNEGVRPVATSHGAYLAAISDRVDPLELVRNNRVAAELLCSTDLRRATDSPGLHIRFDSARACHVPLSALTSRTRRRVTSADSPITVFHAIASRSETRVLGAEFGVELEMSTRTVGRGPFSDAPPFPIDVVFTWVDGTDGDWAARRRIELDAHPPSELRDHRAENRWRNADELRSSLRTVWLYAPWVRSIFIVTDRQRPRWLRDHPKVSVVDHTEIIPRAALPTFNSHAIEAHLHRIPELAEHYLYFNDDVFLGSPTDWTVFFTPSGQARFFPSTSRIPDLTTERTDRSIDAATLNGRRLLADRLGIDAEFKMKHTPHSQRKSVHDWMASEFAQEIESTAESRFRSPTDQSVASFLHHYVGEHLGSCVRGQLHYDYFSTADPHLADRLQYLSERPDPLQAYCVNDDVPTGHCGPNDLVHLLERTNPFVAPWEQ